MCVHHANLLLSSRRLDLAAATSEFSHTLTVLSGSSLSRSLSTCFAGLGELEVRAKELTDAQAEADVRQIGNIMYEYERVVGSVRVSGIEVFRQATLNNVLMLLVARFTLYASL